MADAPAPMPEFATTGEGYSPDKFYCRTTDEQGERSYIGVKQIAVPPYIIVKAEQLVIGHEWPAYRSIPDVLRDGFAHIVHRRLIESGDPEYNRVADEWGRWWERDHLEMLGKENPQGQQDWARQFANEQDPERRAYLVLVAREHATHLPMYWRQQLLALCDRYAQ